MVWIQTFPYKCQVATIIIGLSAVSCGIIFWLIALGMTSPMWKIMAISSLILGATCTLTGSIWCCCAVQSTGSDVYGQFKEGEADTQISEATEMIRWNSCTVLNGMESTALWQNDQWMHLLKLTKRDYYFMLLQNYCIEAVCVCVSIYIFPYTTLSTHK